MWASQFSDWFQSLYLIQIAVPIIQRIWVIHQFLMNIKSKTSKLIGPSTVYLKDKNTLLVKVKENVIRIRKTLQHINLIQQKSCINIVWVLDRKLCEVESAFVVVFVQIREIRIDPNNFSGSNSIAQKYACTDKEKISSENLMTNKS